MTDTTGAFGDMTVEHVEFYVNALADKTRALTEGYGLRPYATTPGEHPEVRSVALGRHDIRLVLTEALTDDHPATAYVDRHGDGVADIALRVNDVPAAFTEAVRRGARAVAGPQTRDGITTATIIGFGDVVHTFVQRADGAEPVPSGLRLLPGAEAPGPGGMFATDHFAVCLEAGQLDATVAFYEHVLDFEMIFTERIVVGDQAMDSKVVQSRSGAVTLTLIEPDLSQASGQIDEFIKNHGGPGVQHIAFNTDDIVRTVGTLADEGIGFLQTPDTYYQMLTDRLHVIHHPVGELARLGVLVDEDHGGQLYQIFARSTHPRNTFFFEIIERRGAQTFGSGNIKALYEAVELQRRTSQAPQR